MKIGRRLQDHTPTSFFQLLIHDSISSFQLKIIPICHFFELLTHDLICAFHLSHFVLFPSSGSLVPLSVTAAMSTGGFTAVFDALIDPLCEEDIVLGKDWIDLCALNGVSLQFELLPVYSSGDLLFM